MPRLTVVDVGHGNAAVLEDSAGVAVVDTGRGTILLEFLRKRRIAKIGSLILSHADVDHIGGAMTLLHDPKTSIREVFANPDSSKNTQTWKGVVAALALARAEGRLKLNSAVHTGVKVRPAKAPVQVEVLYPPPEALLLGTASAAAPKTNSNSQSVALRIHLTAKHAVVLGGDVEFASIDFWKKERVNVSAFAIVFPHHGGAPGGHDPALFAYELALLVAPQHVAFSIHETLYSLPRADVVSGITKAAPGVRFMCTQLSAFGKTAALAGEKAWAWHCIPGRKPAATRAGHIVFTATKSSVTIGCDPTP